MSGYVLSIIIIGLASLGMAWMPSIAERTRVSYAIIYVLFGMLIYALFPALPTANPLRKEVFAVHLTELVVIISLMGTGLKIDQPFSFKTWRTPFRLVSITMILSIAIIAFLAHWILKFDIASSILLGAVLAPTDPVLASDVQVGPPLEETKDNVRFSLTAEAGMNDGTAFPFTWLAIILSVTAFNSESIGLWLVRDVVYRMVAGVAMGFLLGRLLAYIIFTLPQKHEVVVVRDGFVGVATTLLVYGLTELVWGYGFIAVFVTAVTLRNYELNHKYHRKLHDFTEQIERILVAIVLLLFGGSLVEGVLQSLTANMVWIGLLVVLLVRPVTGLLGMIGEKLRSKEKLTIAFFGIRGMGSLFYLSFALHEGKFSNEKELWAIVSFIIVLSLVTHGLTATTVFKKLDKAIPPRKADNEEKRTEG